MLLNCISIYILIDLQTYVYIKKNAFRSSLKKFFFNLDLFGGFQFLQNNWFLKADATVL